MTARELSTWAETMVDLQAQATRTERDAAVDTAQQELTVRAASRGAPPAPGFLDRLSGTLTDWFDQVNQGVGDWVREHKAAISAAADLCAALSMFAALVPGLGSFTALGLGGFALLGQGALARTRTVRSPTSRSVRSDSPPAGQPPGSARSRRGHGPPRQGPRSRPCPRFLRWD